MLTAIACRESSQTFHVKFTTAVRENFSLPTVINHASPSIQSVRRRSFAIFAKSHMLNKFNSTAFTNQFFKATTTGLYFPKKPKFPHQTPRKKFISSSLWLLGQNSDRFPVLSPNHCSIDSIKVLCMRHITRGTSTNYVKDWGPRIRIVQRKKKIIYF